MRGAFRTVAVPRSALSARRDLLLEMLALRHQLGVLGRSGRRFRPADRLLWVCLRWFWPRWRYALVLVQPATVARWHREGLRGCWKRRSPRRPGRPRIDSQLRSLIGRMAEENGLWGAPRIHGELLKLGFTVSERTVSRYLPDRLTRPSQTWRTFLANHFGHLAVASTVTPSFTMSDDDVEASVLSGRPVPPSREGRYASNQSGVVDWPPSRQPTSRAWRVAQGHLHNRTHIRFSSGKDPPQSRKSNSCWRRTAEGSSRRPEPHLADGADRRKPRVALCGIRSSTSLPSRQVLAPRLQAHVHRRDCRNIGESPRMAPTTCGRPFWRTTGSSPHSRRSGSPRSSMSGTSRWSRMMRRAHVFQRSRASSLPGDRIASARSYQVIASRNHS